MKKTLQMILAFFFFVGCSTPPSLEEPQAVGKNDWIYGMWLTVSVSETLVERSMEKRNTGIEKHILYFMRNGELRRYSKSKDWLRLLIDFKVEGDIVMMHPHTEKGYSPLSRRIDGGKLELLVPPYGRYTYIKLDNNFDINDIDLNGSPEIEETNIR